MTTILFWPLVQVSNSAEKYIEKTFQQFSGTRSRYNSPEGTALSFFSLACQHPFASWAKVKNFASSKVSHVVKMIINT